jgi:hypothetical protein
MSIFRQFKTNTKREIEGVPVTFGANDDGSVPTFFVARASQANVQYTKELERVSRPFKRQIQLGILPDDKNRKIYLEVFIGTLLKGWENIQDEDGKEIDFTADNARMIFADESMADLYNTLIEVSNSAALYREGEIEEQTKN